MLKIDNVQITNYSGEPVQKIRLKTVENEAIQGDLNVTILGVEKRDFEFTFENIEKAEYEEIFEYVNDGVEHYVEIYIGSSLVFANYAFIKCDDVGHTNNVLYSFSILVREL